MYKLANGNNARVWQWYFNGIVDGPKSTTDIVVLCYTMYIDLLTVLGRTVYRLGSGICVKDL